MSNTLQIALLVACVAVTLMATWLIPLSIVLYLHARTVARQIEEVKMEWQRLIHDTRITVQNILL